MVIKTGILLILLYPALADLRSRQFYLVPPVAGTVCLIVLQLSDGVSDEQLLLMAAGVIPGILLGILSKVTEGSIGMGDVIIIGCLGLVMGITDLLLVLLAAFVMSGLAGLGLIIFRKAGKKTVIPFVPFLMAGYLLFLWGTTV